MVDDRRLITNGCSENIGVDTGSNVTNSNAVFAKFVHAVVHIESEEKDPLREDLSN
jgi:hypothetical protein